MCMSVELVLRTKYIAHIYIYTHIYIYICVGQWSSTSPHPPVHGALHISTSPPLSISLRLHLSTCISPPPPLHRALHSPSDDSVITRFLSLGVTAAISITVGSVVVCVVCVVCTICCCCRCMRKRTQDPASGATTTTTATSVTINNGGPPLGALQHHVQHGEYAIHNGGPLTMNMNVAMAPGRWRLLV